MYKRRNAVANFLFAAQNIILITGPTSAIAETAVKASMCAIAAENNASGNILNCYIGLTPEQLRGLVNISEISKESPKRDLGQIFASICAVAAKENANKNEINCSVGPNVLVDQIQTISHKLQVNEQATLTLLRIVGEEPNLPNARLADELIKIASSYNELKSQVAGLNPDNPAAKALVASAQIAIEAGQLDGARALLRQATEAQLAAAEESRKLRDQAQAAYNSQRLGAANSMAAEGKVAQIERRYLEAAELYAKAATYLAPENLDDHSRFLNQQARVLFFQGRDRGDNESLLKSIEIYRATLVERPQQRVPLQWADTQNSLGHALRVMGDREVGTTRLEQSIEAYTAALRERTFEQVPFYWAATQSSLANTLQVLGEREQGTTRFEQAVKTYNSALQVITREQEPLSWALVQNGLGSVLYKIGTRKERTEELEWAVLAYNNALQELTREQVPDQWARTKHNLCSALLAIGKRESGTFRFDQAVEACRAALEERTRERVPFAWAATQNNLGNALNALGKKEKGIVRLEQAAEAYKGALGVWTRDRVPLDWARTQNNLAGTLQLLGERVTGTLHLEQAVEAYNAALLELTLERAPYQWAKVQYNLGEALQALGEREKGTKSLKLAIKAFDASLSVNKTAWPPEWVGWVRVQRTKVASEVKRRQK